MIDAHHHFWKIDRGDYHWLADEKEILRRDYLPQDLAPLLQKTGIQKTILVQAAETIEETIFLLDLTRHLDFVAGVVGWIDFDNPDTQQQLDRLCHYPKFVGIRPVLQAIEDTNWLLSSHRLDVLKRLQDHNKCFDALIQPRHLDMMTHLILKLPDLSIVIDHGAKPNIAQAHLSPWQEKLAELAQHQNLYCKLSGLVTEAAPEWHQNDLKPYLDVLLSCFGPDRLMWGSDWPVVNNTATYAQWHDLAQSYIQAYTPEAQQRIFSENASRFYKIDQFIK